MECVDSNANTYIEKLDKLVLSMIESDNESDTSGSNDDMTDSDESDSNDQDESNRDDDDSSDETYSDQDDESEDENAIPIYEMRW